MLKLLKIGAAQRVFFLILAVVLWLGIWLTGFGAVHWVLYIPAIALALASITGLCPGMMFSRMMFKGKGA